MSSRTAMESVVGQRPPSADLWTFASPEFKAFARKRRAGASGALTSCSLLAEWKELSADARGALEHEERGNGLSASAGTKDRSGGRSVGAGTKATLILQQQQRRYLPRPAEATRSSSPTSRPRKKSKGAAVPEIMLPRPLFPKRPTAAAALDEQRRRHLTEALKAQASERGVAVSVAASHDVDLVEAGARLLAPSLSFDWVPGDEAAEDPEPCLEVDLPEAKATSGGLGAGSGRRGLLRRELSRNISAARMQSLMAKEPLEASKRNTQLGV